MKNILAKLMMSLILMVVISYQSKAQLFDRLKKRTMDKLEKKAEDKLVEELSEEIAKRAFKPIDKAMDDMLKSSFESETGDSIDWEEAGKAYQEFLLGLNKKANVPDQYIFDIYMDVEIKDGEKDKHEARYYFSTQSPLIGIVQENNSNNNLLVIDNKNDVIVMYTTDSEGNKTAQAIPSAMSMASTFVQANSDNNSPPEYKINKTGKTKKIEGYECNEYEIESDIDEIEMYVAPDFPVSMHTAFGSTYESFLPENYYKSTTMTEGMVLYSEYKSKENKKYNSTFKTKKIKEESMTIDNREYGLSGSN